MTDRDRDAYARQDRETRSAARDEPGRPGDRQDGERRSWSADEDESDAAGRSGSTPYGRMTTGSADRSEGYGHSGGYGDQGGFGSQHGQGGYASPARGAAYGQTGAEWGRSGYGSAGQGQQRSGRSYGGGESAGFGHTSSAAEHDDGDRRYQYDSYGAAPGRNDGRPNSARGTYGQGEDARSAQRSEHRSTQTAGRGGFPYESEYRVYKGGDDRGRSGASGGYDRSEDHEHEPSYRRWRDEQLASHDQDYNRWRDEQGRRYDDEYRAYRDQRHQSFTKGFGDWRDKNQPSQPSTTHPSQTQDRSSASSSATTSTAQIGGETSSATSASPAGYGTAAGSALAGESAVQNVANGGARRTDHRDDVKSAPTDGDKAG